MNGRSSNVEAPESKALSGRPSKLRLGLLLSVLSALLLAACSSDSPTAPGAPHDDALMVEVIDGNNQTARIGSVVPQTPTVRVRSQSGAAKAGISVTFAVTSGGGTVSGSTAVTNNSGEATVGSWTLGPDPGANTLTAAIDGADPVVISATARLPRWTVMVYLAADNNLALNGLVDLIEMEAAGFDPEVQVVMQAEFGQDYMELNGITPQSLGLQSWDTFRYFIDGSPARLGPDGEVSYLGTVDMTAEGTLREFVQWASAEYPAERYILVPWNHGGGYVGLIQDETQGGPEMMSMAEFRSALLPLEPLDIIDFDMCLMGGYETLLSVSGLTDVVIFSEALEPGDGNPYRAILDGLQANPDASTEEVARLFVDEFADSYTDGRSSITKSAYDVEGLDALDASISDLAATLALKLPDIAGDLVTVLGSSQKFAYRELTDVAHFAELLAQQSADPEVIAAANAVAAAATPSAFRLAHRQYSAPDGENFAESTGLHFVFPSGIGEDAFDDSGRRSLAAYEANYPSSPWGAFLEEWASTLTTTTTVDLGEGHALEVYEVWDEATVQAGADIDFWLWEPVERLFVPWQGTVTTNGVFTADSYQSDPSSYFEGWLSRQVIQQGQYKIYADLWTGPADHQTNLDVAYRLSSTDEFSYLYAPSVVNLNFSQRIEDDPTPTLAEVDAGLYSDFKLVATWDVAPPGTPLLIAPKEDRAAAAPEALQALGEPIDLSGWVRERRERNAPGRVIPQAERPSGLAIPVNPGTSRM